jgi:adenine phosphoribosyltransferase
MNLHKFIRDIPNFPKNGILYRDITPLLQNPEAFSFSIDKLSDSVEKLGGEAIVGIESRGFIFGAPVALRLGLPFIPVRKAGKLPAERKTVEYSLEYGQSQLDIHLDALVPGQGVVIIDDLLATGGTAC